MKKLLALLLLSLIMTNLSSAQQLENSLLWKISGNGLEQPSYLYGTVHITCDASLSPKILKALDDTKQLTLELDMDDPNLQMDMMGGVMMKDGITIKSLLSEEDYKLLNNFITTEIGMSLDMMNGMKPFMVNAMFYPKMLSCPVQSFESELMKVSKEQEEEIIGLETVAEQLAVFDAIPYKEQLKDLMRSVKDKLAFDKEFFSELINVYAKEDLNALMQMMDREEYIVTSEYGAELVTDRNKNWIPKIVKMAKGKPTFFGVGAGHLGGKEGVIMLLRDAGYTVEAVMN